MAPSNGVTHDNLAVHELTRFTSSTHSRTLLTLFSDASSTVQKLPSIQMVSPTSKGCITNSSRQDSKTVRMELPKMNEKPADVRTYVLSQAEFHKLGHKIGPACTASGTPRWQCAGKLMRTVMTRGLHQGCRY